MFSCFYERQRGSVLLLSLLILASILASSVAVGTLVARGIRANRQVDDALRAYYAAESGVERGLWRMKREPLQAAQAVNISEVVSVSNDADVETHMRLVNRGTRVTISHIVRGGSHVVDVYKADGFSVATPGAGISSISWTAGEGEVRIVCHVWSYTTEDGVQFVPCAGITTNGTTLSGLNPEQAYRFTFQAVGTTDARQVALLADGGAATLPTPVRVEAEGTSPRSRQALSIEIPSRSPLTIGAVIDVGDGTRVNTETGEIEPAP